MIYAWHFTGDTLRDGTKIPPVGHTLNFCPDEDGPIKLCEAGFHASEDPWDALYYAPGTTLHHVRMEGEMVKGNDKLVARRRTIVKSREAMGMLKSFARFCALSVRHHWDMPKEVHAYLTDHKFRARHGLVEVHSAFYRTRSYSRHSIEWHAKDAAHKALNVPFRPVSYCCYDGFRAATYASARATGGDIGRVREDYRKKFREMVTDLFAEPITYHPPGERKGKPIWTA